MEMKEEANGDERRSEWSFTIQSTEVHRDSSLRYTIMLPVRLMNARYIAAIAPIQK